LRFNLTSIARSTVLNALLKLYVNRKYNFSNEVKKIVFLVEDDYWTEIGSQKLPETTPPSWSTPLDEVVIGDKNT